VPADVSDDGFFAGRYDNPFENVTYAVFKASIKEANLDPTSGF